MIEVESPCGEKFSVPVEKFQPVVFVGPATSEGNAVGHKGCLFRKYLERGAFGYYHGRCNECGLDLEMGVGEGDDLHSRSFPAKDGLK